LSKERIELLAKIGKMPKQALTQSKVQQPKLTITYYNCTPKLTFNLVMLSCVEGSCIPLNKYTFGCI
jgi:hypothetical protein